MQMIPAALCLGLLLTSLQTSAQEHVVNGDFETLTTCPLEPGDLYLAQGWHTQAGTPDFYHTCAEKQRPGLNALRNFNGYRTPYAGAGYAGLYVLYYQHWLPSKQAYRETEALYNRLQRPLVVGKRYVVSFYVSRADSSEISADSAYVTLTREPPAAGRRPGRQDLTTGLWLPNAPEWRRVAVEFTARQPFAYLWLSLPREKIPFATYKSTIDQGLGRRKSKRNRSLTAYYYIDNVSVAEMTPK